ncbi:unnamed protein product, partial [Rotaria magnacalcarata]
FCARAVLLLNGSAFDDAGLEIDKSKNINEN